MNALLKHLMKEHHILSLVVKDLAKIKTFYPSLYADAQEALRNNRQLLKEHTEKQTKKQK
jgi:hypothetical protein